MKNIRVFHLKIFQFLEAKFSTYLNRRVFVMWTIHAWAVSSRGNCCQLQDGERQLHYISKGVLLITKTYLYNFDPLKSHFYIVKLGFTGVYIIFLFLLKNIDYGYSLEPPRRGGSNESPQSMF